MDPVGFSGPARLLVVGDQPCSDAVDAGDEWIPFKVLWPPPSTFQPLCLRITGTHGGEVELKLDPVDGALLAVIVLIAPPGAPPSTGTPTAGRADGTTPARRPQLDRSAWIPPRAGGPAWQRLLQESVDRIGARGRGPRHYRMCRARTGRRGTQRLADGPDSTSPRTNGRRASEPFCTIGCFSKPLSAAFASSTCGFGSERTSSIAVRAAQLDTRAGLEARERRVRAADPRGPGRDPAAGQRRAPTPPSITSHSWLTLWPRSQPSGERVTSPATVSLLRPAGVPMGVLLALWLLLAGAGRVEVLEGGGEFGGRVRLGVGRR